MAELATYIGIETRTAQNTSGSTIARGLRVILSAAGVITLAGAGVRGDYITLQDIANNEVGLVASMGGGGKVPAVASATVAVGDDAFAAAGGQVSNAGTAFVGRWTQPATVGVLGEVELGSVE